MEPHDTLRNTLCLGCEKTNIPLDIHHIKSRGSGGSDEVHNLIPLCRSCHIEIHKGRNKFIDKRPKLKAYLKSMGWHLVVNKWIHTSR